MIGLHLLYCFFPSFQHLIVLRELGIPVIRSGVWSLLISQIVAKDT